MKALVATERGHAGDFSHCVPGELVYAGAVCSRDQDDPDSPTACGCARVFTGLNSGQATTAAEVVDLELTADDFREAVRSGLEQAGWTAFGVDPGEVADELAEIAGRYPVGTVLGRRGDELIVRTP